MDDRMHLPQDPKEGSTPTLPPILATLRRWDRAILLRCGLMTALSLTAGAALFVLLRPAIDPHEAAHIISRHIGVGVPPVLVFLRLWMATLPTYLIISVAGLTRISGGLTAAVLALRGLSDGAAAVALLAVVMGHTVLSIPAASPVLLLAAFLVRAGIDAVTRSYLAAKAKRLATDPILNITAPPTAESRAALRFRLWTYLACTLITTGISAVATGAYVLALHAAI